MFVSKHIPFHSSSSLDVAALYRGKSTAPTWHLHYFFLVTLAMDGGILTMETALVDESCRIQIRCEVSELQRQQVLKTEDCSIQVSGWTVVFTEGGAAFFDFRIEQVFGGCRDHNDFLDCHVDVVVKKGICAHHFIPVVIIDNVIKNNHLGTSLLPKRVIDKESIHQEIVDKESIDKESSINKKSIDKKSINPLTRNPLTRNSIH
jgi:hypothetical protein